MFRKIVIGVGSFVGIALIVLSFLDRDVPTAPSGPEEERSGQLQLDTVPLGALTLVADGVVAGNGRGDIRHFSLTGDERTPAVYSVCSNAISAAVLLAVVLSHGQPDYRWRCDERQSCLGRFP